MIFHLSNLKHIFSLWKDLTVEEANRLAYENAKDIIACKLSLVF